MAFNLVFIGAPLLDVSLISDSNCLEKYHLKADNCIRATKEHRELFVELLRTADAVWTAGGSAQNSARVCKYVLGDYGTVSFVGGVGSDEFATKMEDQIRKDGVIPLYSIHPSLPTGVCACLITDGGKRSMIADLGASETYNLEDFKTPQVDKAMLQAKAVFITGYFLSHSADVAMLVANFCSEKKKLFAISLSATYVCKVHVGILMECMAYADIVFGNLEEATTLLESLKINIDGNKPKNCAQTIANLPKTEGGKRVVIITNGSEPVSACESGRDPEEFDVPRVEDFVDPTGCGDAMAGAFLATFVKSMKVDQSVQSGIEAAARIARARGCVLD